MSVKLRASSGTYNVQASELARDMRQPVKTVRCIVHFLDDTEATFEIDVSEIITLKDELVQERCNSSALAMELHLSCINPSKWDMFSSIILSFQRQNTTEKYQ